MQCDDADADAIENKLPVLMKPGIEAKVHCLSSYALQQG
jgi:hypothetical protein